MAMDETLYNVSEKVQNFAVIYLGRSQLAACQSPLSEARGEADQVVDITEVPDFNKVSTQLSVSRLRGAPADEVDVRVV